MLPKLTCLTNTKVFQIKIKVVMNIFYDLTSDEGAADDG